MLHEVTCLSCGWVSFTMTRAEAEANVARFNEYYAKMSPAEKENYTGPATLEAYEGCPRCGNTYKNFREALPDDAPAGVTLNPVIRKED